jgi:NADH dehydrogenase
MRVLVLGGTGFLGRHVVAALAARDHVVLIGTAPAGRYAVHDDDVPLQRLARFEWLTEPARWEPLLEGVDAVVNCVGILREFGAPRTSACTSWRRRRSPRRASPRASDGSFTCPRWGCGATRAAASSSPSCAARSRCPAADGLHDRAAVAARGNGGYGSDWLRRMASWPVHCIPHEAVGRIAVVDVRDVADAIAVLCVRATPRRFETVELGGRSAFTLGNTRHAAAARRPAARHDGAPVAAGRAHRRASRATWRT